MRLVARFHFVRGAGHLREQGGIGLIIPVRELSGETFYAGELAGVKLDIGSPTPFTDRICSHPLEFAKAETLRKRLLPAAREHGEVFAFVRFRGPPTNNHAGRRAPSVPCDRW